MSRIKELLVIIVLILAACSPTKQITGLESDITGLYAQERYDELLLQYDKLLVLKNKNNTPLAKNTLLLAGKAAYKTSRHNEALDILRSINDLQDLEAIMMMGESLELTARPEEALDYWQTRLPLLEGSEHYRDIVLKIYRTQQRVEDYEAANQTWQKIDPQNDSDLMYEQVEVLSKLNRTQDALTLSKQILKLEPKHEKALFNLADYYYNKAENWYKSEMDKYNRNPNNTTYAYLRRELKKISADFRTARDLLETLHSVAPENKLYMAYLANTYIRLDMKKEAEQMTKKLEEN
ncbi:MAG: hypothetical protein GXY94_12960 [Bacteroidales bacterium]|jgi:tetratricopeptide (TPR) repeat protein|nr:hypothetical protein [Bacteroidales bacterium]